ncbi:MAG: hypothetical protein ACOX6T_07825 [Myxococcales bacterium]|jgi:hypothetical protein
MTSRRAPLATVLALLALPATSRAAQDWFASLYTNEGIEMRADERIFALYAALNAMGYDEAPVTRRFPVPAREMHPVRLKVREALTVDRALAEKLDAFFTEHPETADVYGRHALTLRGPPTFEPSADSSAALRGIEPLLAEVYSSGKLADLFGQVQDEYRSVLKGYHAVIDGPVLEVRRLLKMKEDEPPRVTLVINLLDGRGSAFSGLVGEDLYVVLGPSTEPDLYSLVKEVARAKLAPVAASKAGTSKVLRDIAAAVGAKSAADFATEVFARAFAAAVVKPPEDKLAEIAAGGYHAALDVYPLIDKFVSSGSTLESFVAENLWILAKEPAAK